MAHGQSSLVSSRLAVRNAIDMHRSMVQTTKPGKLEKNIAARGVADFEMRRLARGRAGAYLRLEMMAEKMMSTSSNGSGMTAKIWLLQLHCVIKSGIASLPVS